MTFPATWSSEKCILANLKVWCFKVLKSSIPRENLFSMLVKNTGTTFKQKGVTFGALQRNMEKRKSFLKDPSDCMLFVLENFYRAALMERLLVETN